MVMCPQSSVIFFVLFFHSVRPGVEYSDHWQVQETSQGTLYLWNAYLDNRTFSDFFWPYYNTVRILGMLDNKNPKNLYCQIWYDQEENEVVPSEFFWIWDKDWIQADFYQPYLFSCETSDARVPSFVSLVDKSWDGSTTNKLKINYEKVDRKEDFVVCVKGLDFPDDDKSIRIIEWLELLKLLGANKVHFYKFNLHPNIEAVLDFYTKLDQVEVTPLFLVGNSSLDTSKFLREHTAERRLQEVLPFNDCLYRYMYRYKYIVSLDIDEVILPVSGTWQDLMNELKSRNGVQSSYLARNVYFFDDFEESSDDIPDYMHILRHVRRAKMYSRIGDYVKGFHDTNRVKVLYNHISLWCFDWWSCSNFYVDVRLAQLQHYRKECVKEISNCDELKEETVLDDRVRKFKNELIVNVEKVLEDLQDHLLDCASLTSPNSERYDFNRRSTTSWNN